MISDAAGRKCSMNKLDLRIIHLYFETPMVSKVAHKKSFARACVKCSAVDSFEDVDAVEVVDAFERRDAGESRGGIVIYTGGVSV